MITSLFLVLLLLQLSITQQSKALHHVADEEAKCLDGSRGTYYYEAGNGSGSDKYILYFEGGGWIQGTTYDNMLLYAYDRTSTSLGSSINLPSKAEMSGIFSTNQQENPELYNWHHIYINYCDGTGHQGYASQPLVVKDKLIYIRGEKIIKSILQEFQLQFSAAKKVLVTGCSAGGLAAFTWAEYVRDYLPQTVQVLLAPDSGIFQDMPPIDGTQSAKERRQQQYMKVANVEVDPPNSQCVQYYSNEKWKCHFAQFMLPFISVPIFFVQSLYDAACIPNILKIYSASDLTLSRCSQKELNYIEAHHSNMQIIIDGRLQSDKTSGAFAPACLEHCFLHKTLYQSASWEIPSQSGMTIAKALSSWVLNQDGEHNHSDYITWPNNSGCSNLNNQ